MTVAIIDHGSGNLRSAAKAFAHAGGDVVVTARADDVARASRIVLPGVGAFGDCRAGLMALDGMVEALEDAVLRRGVPFLGICVGMQLMASRGLEGAVQDGLGWIDGTVEAIAPDDKALKVPHMEQPAYSPGPSAAGGAGRGAAYVLRAWLSPRRGAERGRPGDRRSWRRGHRDGGARQYRRHAVSS
jgi:glutamine amidotransferase